MAHTHDEVHQLMHDMPKGLNVTVAQGLHVTILFDLAGPEGGQYFITIDDGAATVHDACGPTPDTILHMTVEDYVAIALGRITGQEVFLDGRMRVEGSVGLAMRMGSLFTPLSVFASADRDDAGV